MCCRTARKQCCVSYLKEKSCVAGALGAKDGEACGLEDSDSCGASLYKASSAAAWAGPRVLRARAGAPLQGFSGR